MSGVSIPRRTGWKINKKKRNFAVGEIVKRKDFDNDFRIVQILTLEGTPLYKLWNITKNCYYNGVKEEFLVKNPLVSDEIKEIALKQTETYMFNEFPTDLPPGYRWIWKETGSW